MALTINTNMGALIVQNNLAAATKAMNLSIERMTTGYKINDVKDDPAGYAVMTKMDTSLKSNVVAQSNVEMGSSLLSTTGSNYDLVISHLQRIRDLVEQGANGTYAQDSLDAMKAEVTARMAELDRIAQVTEFNGINLMDGSVGTAGINLQVGIDSSTNSQITLSQSLFASVKSNDLLGSGFITDIFKSTTTAANWSTALGKTDDAIETITTRATELGAVQNRLDSASEALSTQYDNLTSSLSTIRDTDIAAESSNFIKAQILQQASATLLTTANQAPSIALNLI